MTSLLLENSQEMPGALLDCREVPKMPDRVLSSKTDSFTKHFWLSKVSGISTGLWGEDMSLTTDLKTSQSRVEADIQRTRAMTAREKQV